MFAGMTRRSKPTALVFFINPNLQEKWSINRSIFMDKWIGKKEFETVDRVVENA